MIKIKLVSILIFTLSFSLVTLNANAKNFKAGREMYKLVSKIKKGLKKAGDKKEALASAKLLFGFKVHDSVVENLLFNFAIKEYSNPELRAAILKSYIRQAQLGGHDIQAVDNLASHVGKFGQPDPIQIALGQLGPKTLPRLVSLIKCPKRKSTKKTKQLKHKFDPLAVAKTVESIVKKNKTDPSLQAMTAKFVTCMKCRSVPLAMSCSQIISALPMIGKQDLLNIRKILHSHKDFKIKTKAADIIARQYLANKEVKSLLRRSMNHKRANVRLAATIAMYLHIDKSPKIKKALLKFSKSKNTEFREKVTFTLSSKELKKDTPKPEEKLKENEKIK